jgi:hypothetical protein
VTTKTKTDSTIDEIHEIRREISDRFSGDVFAIARDAARRQLESGRPTWQPRITNKPIPPSGESIAPSNDAAIPADE